MSRAVEYLDEAIEEAEAAARWYAERSSSAATGFADEVDAAIAAIEQTPEAWPSYDLWLGPPVVHDDLRTASTETTEIGVSWVQ